MLCPYCNSNNIRNVKVHITKPVGSKKHVCLECNKTFITHPEENNQMQKLYEIVNK